jgi:putative phosphoribosyl transferase
MTMTFRDRVDAGRQLAELLSRYRAEHPVVLALPRGGVPVAAEVADALGAPLDVLVVRKLGYPWQPELGMGAIAEGGVTVLNTDLIERIGADDDTIRSVQDRERVELERRVRRYRGDRPPLPVDGRTVILVDDGIATGSTAHAAIDVLKHRGAARVVLAAPVAPPEAVEDLRHVADEVVTVRTPRHFMAIGQFYDDFTQTGDEEVARLLADRPATSQAPAPSDVSP